MSSTTAPLSVIERMRDAINAHDLDTLAACFAPDYASEFPAHPDRAFRGTGPMRGVTIQGVHDDRVVWARLYMEPVETGGACNDAAIRAGIGESRPT